MINISVKVAIMAFKSACYLWLAFIFGCANERTHSHTLSEATRSNLTVLALPIVELSRMIEIFDARMTPDILITELIARRLLSIDDVNSVTVDAWGNPVIIQFSSELRTVYLVSCGRNEQFDHGQGDDVRVEVRLPVDRQPTIFFRFRKEDGREHTYVLSDL